MWLINDGKWFQHGVQGFLDLFYFLHFLAADDISKGPDKDAFTFKYLTASLTSFYILDDVNSSRLLFKKKKIFHDLGFSSSWKCLKGTQSSLQPKERGRGCEGEMNTKWRMGTKNWIWLEAFSFSLSSMALSCGNS